MTLRRRVSMLLLLIPLAGIRVPARGQSDPRPDTPLVERVADTGFLHVQAEGFRQLDARHQALAYMPPSSADGP